MTKQQEAMRLALEALGQLWLFSDEAAVIANPAISAIRETLAEHPAQHQCKFPLCHSKEYQQAIAEQIKRELYTGEPAQQDPVAWLVDNGGDSILIRHSQNFPGVFAGSEFNKRPLVFGDISPQAQPQQEPVAYAVRTVGGKKWHSIHASKESSDRWLEYRVKEQAQGETYEQLALYTSPPAQRKPLTDEEIDALWLQHDFIRAPDRKRQAFARAIEAKLKEKNQ